MSIFWPGLFYICLSSVRLALSEISLPSHTATLVLAYMLRNKFKYFFDMHMLLTLYSSYFPSIQSNTALKSTKNSYTSFFLVFRFFIFYFYYIRYIHMYVIYRNICMFPFRNNLNYLPNFCNMTYI